MPAKDLSERSRKAEILDTAANVFAAMGVRASMKDIADACNILPGSIYFHFESKDAIIVDIIQRYQDDLDSIVLQAKNESVLAGKTQADRVIAFGQAIALCAVRHPAALLMTIFEPPAGASDELRRLMLRTPTVIHEEMLDLLRSGDDIRPLIDQPMLSNRLCESMMRHGIVDSNLGQGAERLPELRCRVLLDGLARQMPSYATLDSSAALRAAKQAVASWQDDCGKDERTIHLLSVARTEFARRGYEVATTREIVAASGLSIGAVYRLFPSKNEMLSAILSGYSERRKAAWDAVLHAISTPLEKLDALTWLYVKLLERFRDEIRIQFGLVRGAPLDTRRIGPLPNFPDMEKLLEEGIRTGEIRPYDGPIDAYARCVSEALWTPENVLDAVGGKLSHELARETVLGGALKRSGQPQSG
jgi:AcrR family transcriptional regulator